MIQIDNVTKYYGETCAINSINLTIPDNSITGFLGVNGAGKSTLLKAIAGVHFATSGDILIDKNNVITEITIDTEYIIKTYPNNVNELIQKFVGEVIEYE